MPFDVGQPGGFVYCEQSDVESEYGVDNIRIWSNRGDKGPDTNAGVVAEAITDACAEIDERLSDSAYQIPLMPTTARGLPRVTRWARVLAGYNVYTRSGISPDGSKDGNQFEAKRAAVLTEITNVKLNLIRIAAVARANNDLVPTTF